MKRVCIYPKDVSILTGKSLAQAQKVLRNLRFILNKRKDQLITFEEYAEYSGINLALIQKICLARPLMALVDC
ncbi:hypothetical protein ASE92_06565 [Pedobacter sp. Leaf41]|uniref:hypothetical protein n=1 Tax=Pedobacter sp. Leaf41 TaxID=1736218 RepID=UPI000702DEC9|nr:hypothetical protein [Pedobacter sp. Leaf41]KQN35804.1 hypothetical protein ASE92_06565 [Pedobacter sp. Leaf41]